MNQAFTELQLAVCEGRVRQQSREQRVAAAWQRCHLHPDMGGSGSAIPFLAPVARAQQPVATAS